jgi:hypothetical protein
MKRSEMIKALQEDFFEKKAKCYVVNWLAEDIIDFLVSQGMQPPAYEKFVESKGLIGPSSDIKLYYKLPCNEWEPEND